MPAHPVKNAGLFASPARRFPQERARRTFEGLVEAGARAFSERGYDATQTPDIAALAGVSVGTFYRYFDDKLEIFLEVMRRELATSYEEVMSRLAPDRFVGVERRAAFEAALEVLLDNLTRRAGLMRVFHQMAMRDTSVAALQREFDNAARSQLAALIARNCSPERVPDVDAAAYVIHTAVVECAITIAGGRGPVPVSRDRAVAGLGAMIDRFLFPE